MEWQVNQYQNGSSSRRMDGWTVFGDTEEEALAWIDRELERRGMPNPGGWWVDPLPSDDEEERRR